MILEYKCSNFKSIKDEVIFSMLASSDTRHSEKLLHFQNKEFNRVSVVCKNYIEGRYGPVPEIIK